MITRDIPSPESLAVFLADLTALCRKHGVAIAGTPQLFTMTKPDHRIAYKTNEISELLFGKHSQ